MSVFLVPDGFDGERVDFASARMTGWSRSRVAEHIDAGRLLVDGMPVSKPSQRLSAGQLIEVEELELKKLAVVPRLADGLAIVYLDDSIVVVNKPAGVAAHPSLGWEGPDVVAHLQGAGISVATSGPAERQGIVQRLDVGTSGLMVVARSDEAYSTLKQAFRDHAVHKTYLALVHGYPDPPEGTIDAPIARANTGGWRFAVRADGRHSVTHYQTIELVRGASLVRIQLETGRTHQIRVHMAAIRHPIVGDPLYGGDPVVAAQLDLGRQWLHASELSFNHPVTGESVAFSCELPADLAHALNRLRDPS